MNRDEETFMLTVLRWTHVVGLIVVGVILLVLWLDRYISNEEASFIFIPFAVAVSAALVRHWLTLRWNRE